MSEDMKKPEEAAAASSEDVQADETRPEETPADAVGNAPADGEAAEPAQPDAEPDAEPEASSEPAPAPVAAEATAPATAAPKEEPAEEPEEEVEEEEEEHGAMGFFDHLGELRTRLVRCFLAALIGFGICYSFAEDLFQLLMAPLVKVFPPGAHLIYTSLTEAFFTYMTVAAVAGVFMASPYIFYQIWCFVAPGLYEEERKALFPIAFFSAFFFVAGALFGYHVVFPNAFDFLLSYTTDMIKPLPTLEQYLSFSLRLLFAFGLIFEMPLFIYFLARLGLVTASWMRRNRKYAILVNFIVAAALTPGPDVLSQLMMAGPLLVLYEISVYVALIFGRKKEAPEEDQTADDAREDLDEDEPLADPLADDSKSS